VKIRVVGSEMFHADRQTDGWTDGETDFSNAPKNGHNYWRFGWYFNRKCLWRGTRSEVNLAVAML